MKKERVKDGGSDFVYHDGRPIYTGDLCTAIINQREHVCIWVRNHRGDGPDFACVPIDYRIGEWLGSINYEKSRYLGNIYELAGKI